MVDFKSGYKIGNHRSWVALSVHTQELCKGSLVCIPMGFAFHTRLFKYLTYSPHDFGVCGLCLADPFFPEGLFTPVFGLADLSCLPDTIRGFCEAASAPCALCSADWKLKLLLHHHHQGNWGLPGKPLLPGGVYDVGNRLVVTGNSRWLFWNYSSGTGAGAGGPRAALGCVPGVGYLRAVFKKPCGVRTGGQQGCWRCLEVAGERFGHCSEAAARGPAKPIPSLGISGMLSLLSLQRTLLLPPEPTTLPDPSSSLLGVWALACPLGVGEAGTTSRMVWVGRDL